MVTLTVYNGLDEISQQETFETIDECIEFMLIDGFFEDFEYLEEDDVIEGLEKNKKYCFSGGYSNVHIVVE